MKKLIVLSAIAALTSGAALASSHDFTPGGTVQVTCEASSFSGSLMTFSGSDIASGSGSRQATFELQCNDPSGADITLTSSNGWLENQDNATYGAKYTATLSVPSQSFSFILHADNAAPNDATDMLITNTATAVGVAAQLDVELTGGYGNSMAGAYADTLLLTVTAI
jgi:hypothetical protein